MQSFANDEFPGQGKYQTENAAKCKANSDTYFPMEVRFAQFSMNFRNLKKKKVGYTHYLLKKLSKRTCKLFISINLFVT